MHRSQASSPALRSRHSEIVTATRAGTPDNAGGNVKVVVRVRAFLPREIERGAKCLIEMNPQTQTTKLLVPNTDDPANKKTQVRKVIEEKSFVFDNSFWSHDTDDESYAHQEDVYNALGEEFLDHNFEGYHTCIFAYGQTGSGKSYTMMGKPDQPGIIPRTCEDLFQRIESNKHPNVSYTVRVSYFEVYNEHVRDLLVPSRPSTTDTSPNYLKIREHPSEGPYIKDLTDLPVRNYAELMRHMRTGDAARTTASTKMNDTSSRSHAVFTIMLKQIIHDLSTDSTTEKVARIRLVDLAGSERAKATEATGARLREGSNINKSLTTLGRVIAALADPKQQSAARGGKGRKDVVPYRDSVLTWLLKDSLGGNSKTAMIACIAPSDYDETLSTLRYADQAKRIRTRATINQDSVSAAQRDAQIAEMQNTIRELQVQVSQANAAANEQSARVLAERNASRDEMLETYQQKVERMQRLMEEERLVGESKIRQLVEQNEALRRHLRLAVESLKNPIDVGVGKRTSMVEGARRTVSGASARGIRVRDSLGRPSLPMQDEEEEDEDLMESVEMPEPRTAREVRSRQPTVEPELTPPATEEDEDEGEPELDWDEEQTPEGTDEQALEMQAHMEALLKDLSLFRRKVADDHSRFGASKDQVRTGPLVRFGVVG